MNQILKTSIASAAALALATGASSAASLSNYDAAIAADNGGALPYEAVLTSAATFDTTNIVAFDWGTITGAATFEFILEGDPDGGGRNGYIGAGSNTANSLRYEQWDNTGSLGFTRSGVADYNLGVPSPTVATHIAYRWDGAGTMDLYVDGVLSGTVGGATFEMPTGAGQLGNVSAGGNEGMLGTIHRVTTYNSALDPADIARHADAWLVPEPAVSMLVGLSGLFLIFRRRR